MDYFWKIEEVLNAKGQYIVWAETFKSKVKAEEFIKTTCPNSEDARAVLYQTGPGRYPFRGGVRAL